MMGSLIATDRSVGDLDAFGAEDLIEGFDEPGLVADQRSGVVEFVGVAR
jgi:hypothetical protein